MKKKLILIALVLVLAISLGLSLVACNPLEKKIHDLQNQINGFEQDFAEKSVTVYVGEEKFDIVTRKAFLHDALKDLKNGGKISAYEYSGGELSPYISQVGDIMQDFEGGKYYSVWHNVNEFSLKGVYSGFKPGRGELKTEGEAPYQTTFVVTTFKGTELFYSNVGVGLLPLVDGAVYAVLLD